MTEVTEKTHAVLSPSGYARWSACPGSVELERPFPNTSSKYARYGTAAHELADICLTAREDAEVHVGRTFTVEGEDIVVDMAMADLVNTYISYVETFLDPSAGDILLPEQQVPLTHMTGEKGAEGTSDVIGFRKRVDGLWTMVIVDLKTGSGVPVFAKDNGQLRMYAGGALAKFGALYDIADVQMVIVQPPLNIVDDETLTVDELRAFMEQVSIAAGRTQIGNAELVPGEKQCRFCRAKSTCPALRDEVISTVTMSSADAFRNLDSDIDEMPKTLAAEIKVADNGDLLAAQMRSLRLVEAWIDSVRAEVERRLFDGQPVPGFKIVAGKKGNRTWADESAALAMLKKTPMKIDEYAPRKVASVTVVEKLLKRDERRWAKFASLITQADGKPSVAPESDPRPPYAVVSGASSFAALSAEKPLTAPAVEVSPELQALLS